MSLVADPGHGSVNCGGGEVDSDVEIGVADDISILDNDSVTDLGSVDVEQHDLGVVEALGQPLEGEAEVSAWRLRVAHDVAGVDDGDVDPIGTDEAEIVAELVPSMVTSTVIEPSGGGVEWMTHPVSEAARRQAVRPKNALEKFMVVVLF